MPYPCKTVFCIHSKFGYETPSFVLKSSSRSSFNPTSQLIVRPGWRTGDVWMFHLIKIWSRDIFVCLGNSVLLCWSQLEAWSCTTEEPH